MPLEESEERLSVTLSPFLRLLGSYTFLSAFIDRAASSLETPIRFNTADRVSPLTILVSASIGFDAVSGSLGNRTASGIGGKSIVVGPMGELVVSPVVSFCSDVGCSKRKVPAPTINTAATAGNKIRLNLGLRVN